MNALTVISWEVFVSLMWCVLFLVFNPVDMFVFAFSWVRPETISLLWLENRVILFHSHLAFLNLELQLLAKIKACFWLLNMPASVSCDTKSEIKNRNTTQHEKGTVKSVNVKKPSCCFSPFFCGPSVPSIFLPVCISCFYPYINFLLPHYSWFPDCVSSSVFTSTAGVGS